VTNMI